MKVLITSGGMRTPIDSVRYISNISTGKLGSCLALEFLKQNDNVNLLYARDSVTPFEFKIDLYKDDFLTSSIILEEMTTLSNNTLNSFNQFEYNTFNDYTSLLEARCKDYQPDIIILTSAVSDYGILAPVDGKISSDKEKLTLDLQKLPKVIDSVRSWAPNAYIIGFKLLVGAKTSDIFESAHKQIQRSGVNLTVVNDLNEIKSGEHRLYLIDGSNKCVANIVMRDYEQDIHHFVDYIKRLKNAENES